MGKIKKGILGGFSGKVGTVVGASWKSISYMLSLPQKVKNPRTLGQRRQRGKFSIVMALLKPLTAILRIGWKNAAKNQTPTNAAMAHTLANAVTGTFPDFKIDYTKVLLSQGSLPSVTGTSATSTNKKINLSWDDNSGQGTAKATDKTLVAIVNPTKGETISLAEGTSRADGEQSIEVPSDWVGNKVEVYLGFASESGKEVANSVHFSEITVLS